MSNTRIRPSVLGVLLLTLLTACDSQGKILKKERSLYQNIRVEQTEDIRCLKFSLKRKSKNQSCINVSNPDQLVFTYTRFLLASLLLNEQPENILIIGLGGGTLSNTLHQLFPKSRIDNVEIDPAVIRVARDYFDFKENSQIRAIAEDGRIFIKRAARRGSRYDLIILDAFNGDYIPEHLMTREFLAETRGLLSPTGVVAANTFATSKLYDHESVTYQAVFGDYFNIRSRDSGNRVILAASGPLPTPEQLSRRAEALDTRLQRFDVDILAIRDLMNTRPDWNTEARLLTDQYAPANLLQSR